MSVNLGETKITDIFKTTGGTGGTSDYNELTNKPQINGVTLTGNKTSEDLGIITGITDAYTKEETQALIESSITGKADKTYVDGQLDLKSDKSTTYTKTEVDNSISRITQNINNKLANKADKSDTYNKEETISVIQSNTTNKADTTYVDAQLNLKADKSDTYTKEEVDDMFDNPTITGDTLPVGSITLWSGSTTPTNWLLCDGREVSRTTYSELFAAIGTVWGAGDGSTSFNLPDFTDKFALGAGGDVDLAETGGEKEVTLTVAHIPPHNHAIKSTSNAGSDSCYVRESSKAVWQTDKIANTGNGQPHNNMPPYVGSYYIIKAKQSAGVIATVVDTLESSSTTDALSANQGKILNDKFKPVVLYDNLSGVNTSFGLNDNVANYSFIEIYFKRQDICSCVKIDNPNGKKAMLSLMYGYYYSNTNHFYMFSQQLRIENTNIVYDAGYSVHLSNKTISEMGVDNSCYVYKVLGYK